MDTGGTLGEVSGTLVVLPRFSLPNRNQQERLAGIVCPVAQKQMLHISIFVVDNTPLDRVYRFRS